MNGQARSDVNLEHAEVSIDREIHHTAVTLYRDLFSVGYSLPQIGDVIEQLSAIHANGIMYRALAERDGQ